MINIQEILGGITINSNGENFKVEDICWKTSFSNKESVLFFKSTVNSHKYIDSLESFRVVVFGDESMYEKSKSESKILISKDDWLNSQKLILDELYPIGDEKIIGITGTNGKTSVSCYLEKLFIHDGKSVLRVGTLGEYLNGEKLSESSLTTPSFIDIRKLLFKNSFDVAIFEASSHSLEQERFYKLKFSLAGWTNFSQDHLDYHETMDEYFKAKLKINNHLESEKILTSDESLLLKNKEVFKTTKSMIFTKQAIDSNKSLGLDFNQKNIELSFGLFEEISGKKSSLNPIALLPARGRFNFIEFKDALVVIDFAHTPDALEKICNSLKKMNEDKKLVVLFGCGGDRDRLKRKLMAQAVEKYADKVFLTSDNPRSEDPMQIINDALEGFKKPDEVNIEVDRESSIKNALSEIENNILLIAGKGHETYQEIMGVKNYFSDFDIVELELSRQEDNSCKKGLEG